MLVSISFTVGDGQVPGVAAVLFLCPENNDLANCGCLIHQSIVTEGLPGKGGRQDNMTQNVMLDIRHLCYHDLKRISFTQFCLGLCPPFIPSRLILP